MAAKLPREDARRNAEANRRGAIFDMVAESIEQSTGGSRWRLEGHSMRPLLLPGDQVTAVSPGRTQVGDILLFRAGMELICHRVLQLEPLILAGDNNQRLDQIATDDLLGKVVSAQRGRRVLPLDRGLIAATAPFIARWHRMGRALLHGPNGSPAPLLGHVAGQLAEMARLAFLRGLTLAWFFARR